MIDHGTALSLVMRLSGLAGFPVAPEGVLELVNALAAAKRASTANSLVSDWLTESMFAPRPAEIGSKLRSMESEEYSTAPMENTHSPANIDAMRAGEVWQPRPYSSKCSQCGGLGFLYAKIPAPKTHPQAGQQFDAVVRCRACKPAHQEEPVKRRGKR